MPMRTKLRHLSPEGREELNRKIRDACYRGLDEIVLWLSEEKGLEISRSAIHRHVVRLRTVDSQAGRTDAQMASVSVNRTRRRHQLLARLGALALEQHQLISELEKTEIEPN